MVRGLAYMADSSSLAVSLCTSLIITSNVRRFLRAELGEMIVYCLAVRANGGLAPFGFTSAC